MYRTHNRAVSSISIHGAADYNDERRQWILEDEPLSKRQDISRQKTLIYMLLLAEAIMSASLSAQIPLLITSPAACSNYSASYIRSLLECAYLFGSTCSVIWGYASDRLGRRAVALLGLAGVLACCLSMGFAKSLPSWVLLRCLAGCFGSALFTSAIAMLADANMQSAENMRTVSRLPLIAVCGGVGPLLQSIVRTIGGRASAEIWLQWPALNGQIACASLIFIVTIIELFCLRETLQCQHIDSPSFQEEEATLLGNKSEDDEALLAVSVVDISEQPPAIGMDDFLSAPSFTILLASFSILSLHSSTFEVLLPHLADSPAKMGGMGLPCGFLDTIITIVKAISALGVFYAIPKYSKKVDGLSLYRQISIAFPGLYVLIPFCAMLTTVSGAPPTSWAVFSTVVVMVKEIFAETAHVLAILLAFSAAPNAACTGTGIGLLGLSNLFKALAVGVSGLSYYVSDAYSVVAINATLWALLVILAFRATCMNFNLREVPLVGQDIPVERFRWNSVFDAEKDIEAVG